MSKDTTDEQMKHYNKIIEQFDSVHMPAKQREIIMTEIEHLISNREKLARIDQLTNVRLEYGSRLAEIWSHEADRFITINDRFIALSNITKETPDEPQTPEKA